jgi:multidrug efflux pump subunit AcrA (membrane-fusion protein)
MEGGTGAPEPTAARNGDVNGSRSPQPNDRRRNLDGWESWYDLRPANGSAPGPGRHRGEEAGSPDRAGGRAADAQRFDQAPPPRGYGTRPDGRVPRGAPFPPGPSPAPQGPRPPVHLNYYGPAGYLPVNGRGGPAVRRDESYGMVEYGPGRAVDGLHSAVVSEPPPAVMTYPRPGEGIQLPPPTGHHPVLVARGTGARLGVRAAVVAVAIVAVLTAVGYGVYAAAQTPPLTDLSAQVVSTGQVALGFPQTGVLSGVFVHPGEQVAAGQMLATETVAGLAQQVTADQQAVANDQLIVRQLKTLLNEASHEAAASTTSQQQVAAAAVSSATAAIASSLPARQAAISAFEAEVSAANQTLQTDESSYANACGSSPTGGSGCQSLAHEVAADKLALSSAQANLSAQQAAQADWEAEASRLLADQQAAQAGLNGDTTLALAPLDVDLANAKSQLVRDQAQLVTDQAKKAEGDLQAPQAATVVSVDGAPGEVVSGSGVAGVSATGGSITVTPGFELFPAQQSTAGSQASPAPIVVLEVGGPLLINVVVPESQIGLVRVGAPVTIGPKVAGPSTAQGVVTEIFPSSIVAAGVVSYEVQVKVTSPAGRRGWLPGMTASATIGR